MAFHFEHDLTHQDKAYKSVLDVFKDVHFEEPKYPEWNPNLILEEDKLVENIQSVQKLNNIDKGNLKINKILNLDIKMETGTGKTYTYLKTIFELNKKFKINKFVVVVPTLPIRLGTEQFLKSKSTIEHFEDRYDKAIRLHVVKSSKSSKKRKREFFPLEISNFLNATKHDQRIHVLLVNSGMINSKTMNKIYDDDTFFGELENPLKLISKCKPVVIMDEPHKFKRDGSTFKKILRMEPQIVIRYGATFPETEGKTDYENLLYNLTAIDAFNNDLVKGIEVHIPNVARKDNIKVRLTSIEDENATLTLIEDKTESSYKLKAKDNLSIIHPNFKNIFIDQINKRFILLSNGYTFALKSSIYPGIYSDTYQSILMKKAIDEHFSKEKILFERPSKIKPLTLFFIDDIYSYREIDGNDTYIKDLFEGLLENKLREIISSDDISEDYRAFLEATLNQIELSHGGYFSKDNDTSDEKIQDEVKEILTDKVNLVKYKQKGSWNVRRFIFSKWTLKEGWDNPNVFTICKLRSSGSEISKLQEVGRGLRLPVNEALFRVRNCECDLSYIVDFTEKDFADELVKAINEDSKVGKFEELTDELMQIISKEYNIEEEKIFEELFNKQIVDFRRKIDQSKLDELFAIFPSIRTSLKPGKVSKGNEKPKVKVIPKNYDSFKELWEKINSKVMISYNIGTEEEVKDVLANIFKKKTIYEKEAIVFSNLKVVTKKKQIQLEDTTSKYYYSEKIRYGEFLKLLSLQINVPVQTIHNALITANQEKKIKMEELFNRRSIDKVASMYLESINDKMLESVKYTPIDLAIHPTDLTDKDGKLKEVLAYKLGSKLEEQSPPAKYLYDKLYYDSNEIDTIKEDIESIIVFGKIPKASIKIPVLNGETYSPDFAYVVRDKKGNTKLHLVIESKAKYGKELSDIEKEKIKLAQKFFDTINHSGIKVKFETQLKTQNVSEIIEGLLNNSL